MSPKYLPLCLLVLGLVLLATTSQAHVQNRHLLSKEESSETDVWEHEDDHDHHHHDHDHDHHPPTTQTNEPSKVGQSIPQNKQAQEEHTTVKDGYPYHTPWKKHPPTKN